MLAVVIAALVLGPAAAYDRAPPNLPWYNWSIPINQRVRLLVSAMSTAEKIGQLNNGAPGIDRLGVPQYDYWNEAAHGVAWAGRATVFPASIGMAATFDVDLLHEAGYVYPAAVGSLLHAAPKALP
jgi:beta-glucosidase